MYDQDQQDFDQDLVKRLTLSANRGIWSNYEPQAREYSTGFYERTKLNRMTNDHAVKNPRKTLQPLGKQPRNQGRKQNQVITNLKNQLQNIKSEVAKLITKEDDEVTSEKGSVRTPSERQKYQDNSSTSSIGVSRKIKNRVSTQLNDRDKYMQLENEILRNELKTIKNKYVTRKQEYKQSIENYKKKVFLLENMVAEGEEQLSQYKIDIEKEIVNIRRDMIVRSEAQSTQVYPPTPKAQSLSRDYEQLKQQVIYLKKRTSEANQEIKLMAIQNNDLQNQLKREVKHVDIENVQSARIQQLSEWLRQRDEIINFKEGQILEMVNKQNIAHQVVQKNEQLIEALHIERQNFLCLEQMLKSKNNELAILQQNIAQNQQIHEKFQNLHQQLNTLNQTYLSAINQKELIQRDLNQLGNILTDLKLKNSELQSQLNEKSNSTSVQQTESVQRCQELEGQLLEFKSNVSAMIRETAQKINELEIENDQLRNELSHLSQLSQQKIEDPYEIQMLKKQNQRVLSLMSQEVQKLEISIIECNNLKETVKDLQQKLQTKTTIEQIHSSNTETETSEKQPVKVKKFEQQEFSKLDYQQIIDSKDKQISTLRNDNFSFQQLYLGKCKQIERINLAHENNIKELQLKQTPLKETIKSLTVRVRQYQQVYTKTLKETKDLLTNTLQIDNSNLDESLKIQMDSITKLRATISNKNQQIHALQDNLNTLGNVVDSLRKQLEIQRNKQVRQKQLVLTSNKNQIEHYENQIVTYQQTITSLEQKILIILSEIKKKDEFITNNLQNSTIQASQAKELMIKYQELFNPNNLNLLQDSLRQQIIKIEKLTNNNSQLMRELCKIQQNNIGPQQKLNIEAQQSQESMSVTDSK